MNGDYTKRNAFWQAFTVLVDMNPKVSVISKLNKLSQQVKGEAAAVIWMFELNEENYELAKIALINEYGDPVLSANKMLMDVQSLDRDRESLHPQQATVLQAAEMERFHNLTLSKLKPDAFKKTADFL